MSHAAALDRLLSLGGELHTPPGEPRRKFDLAHMRALLGALGNPEQRFPSILIAGTNGKGSTAATLASILVASGYTVGLYTSPHLNRVNERIRIMAGTASNSDSELEDAVLFHHLARVEVASAALIADGTLPGPPSFFETVTAIAMLAFSRIPSTSGTVDIAVLEVGMGGRLDATNVVEPMLSIITDISLDHTEWLGPTVADIAREKAGILRPNGTMITLPQHPDANQVLGEVAMALNVRGVNAAEYLPGREASAASDNHYELTNLLEDDGEPLVVHSPLRGQHQQRNIALAIAAARELSINNRYSIGPEQIQQGIRETQWAARLEFVQPQPGRPSILLDVAHNPAGAWALRAALSQIKTLGPRLLVFGCMRDKALTEMAQVLFPVFDHIYLAGLPSPRAATAAELTVAAERTGAASTICIDPKTALAAALDAASTRPDTLLVAAGSVVLVGALRSLLL